MKSMKLLVSLICLLSASSIFAYDTAKSDSRKPKTTLTEIKTTLTEDINANEEMATESETSTDETTVEDETSTEDESESEIE